MFFFIIIYNVCNFGVPGQQSKIEMGIFMKNNRCIIFGAGSFTEKEIEVNDGDYLIAADGGYEHILKLGLTPDIVVGDFDSLKKIPDHQNIVKHPVMKDDTDMMLAVKTGLDRGCRRFDIYGGLGGRLDHTLANMQTISYLSELGSQCFLYGDGTIVTAITNTSVEFDETHRGIISVFCISGKACGVTIKGLKYPLTNATLTCNCPLGVSNEFTGVRSTIAVASGTLIIMYSM